MEADLALLQADLTALESRLTDLENSLGEPLSEGPLETRLDNLDRLDSPFCRRSDPGAPAAAQCNGYQPRTWGGLSGTGLFSGL